MTKKIKISEETQIDRPASRRCLPVDYRDWDRIKRMIKKIPSGSGRWENTAVAALTTCIAFLIAEISNSTPTTLLEFIRSSFGSASVFSLIIALILFYASRRLDKVQKESNQDVLDEMERIQECRNNEEKEPVKSKLKILEAKYGANDNYYDVTQQLNELIEDNEINIKATNDIAGDPIKGIAKKLFVKYKYNGEENEKEYNEKDNIKLP